MDPIADKRFRRILVSAILTPLLFFAAVACLAAGHWEVAAGIAVAAIALMTWIPYRPYLDQPIDPSDRMVEKIIRVVVLVATLVWLHNLPETHELARRLTDGTTLFSWGPMGFLAAIAIAKAHGNAQILRKLNDAEIENYGSGRRSIRFQSGPFRKPGSPSASERISRK